MSYPHDDDFDGYRYGLNESQIREKLRFAIHGDEDENDDIFDSFDDVDESEDEDSDW